MSNVKVKEAGASLGRVNGVRRWRTRLIGVGAGSTGVYTESALQSTGPIAFPVGTQVHMNHDSWRDEDERPEGDVTRLAGVVVTEPVFDSDGLYAEIEFGEKWGPFVEQFHQFIGLSISASGFSTETNEVGLPIIEGFIPSPLNRVDLVTKAGAKGQIIEALEEAFRERKEGAMTPEQIRELTEALIEGLSPVLGEIKEAVTPKVVEEDENEGEDVATVAEAVAKADLPEIARTKVYESVKAGSKVEDAIKEQKDFIEALTKQNEEIVGKVRESGGDTPITPGVVKIAGW